MPAIYQTVERPPTFELLNQSLDSKESKRDSPTDVNTVLNWNMGNENTALYLAQSRRGMVSRTELAALGQWMNAPIQLERPLPSDRPGMVYDGARLQLHVPGRRGQPWHPGMAYRRIRWGQDSLCKALDLRPGESVLDCTLGMGHDTLVLANGGAEVFALEHNAALLMYTAKGIHAYSPKLAARIHVRCVDMRQWVPTLADNMFDHVYIDPMFPETDYDKHSQTWSLLRQLHGGNERPSADLIVNAIRVARRSVLVKLPPKSAPLDQDGLPKGIVVGSKRVQYAKWITEGDASSA